MKTTHSMYCNKGFTLIEVVIYCAVVSMIITFSCMSIYSLGELSTTINTHAKIEMDGNLTLQKSHYELTHDQTISSNVHITQEYISSGCILITLSTSTKDHYFSHTQCIDQ